MKRVVIAVAISLVIVSGIATVIRAEQPPIVGSYVTVTGLPIPVTFKGDGTMQSLIGFRWKFGDKPNEIVITSGSLVGDDIFKTTFTYDFSDSNRMLKLTSVDGRTQWYMERQS